MTTTDDRPTTTDHPEPKYGTAALTVHRHAGQDRVIGDDDYWRISRDAPDPFMDPCPAWCSDLDDGRHHRHDSGPRADRVHLGHRTMVVLEIETTDDQRDGTGTCIPEFLSTYLRQGVNDREPHLWLGLGETNKGGHMTLDEAELLAEVLVGVARRGRAAAGGNR